MTNALNAQRNDEASLNRLARQLSTAIGREPVDARLRSLLGEIDLRRNDKSAAKNLFLSAHGISQTEKLALTKLMLASLEQGQNAEAVQYLDLYLRRWGGSKDISSLMVSLSQDASGYAQLLQAIAVDPPWRSALIRSLATDGEGLALANRLLLDLGASANPPRDGEIRTVVSGLLRNEDFATARNLFLFMLPDESWPLVGLIFNSRFKPTQSSLPFDWVSRNTAEAYLQASDTPPQDGMTVRFLDKPARSISLRQTLLLEPGYYRLKLETSAASLRIPRGLYWRLRCLKPSKEIARLDVAEGTYRNQTENVEFSIPEGCAAQSVELRSGLIIDSWLYRYSGRATFHQISIERTNDPIEQ